MVDFFSVKRLVSLLYTNPFFRFVLLNGSLKGERKAISNLELVKEWFIEFDYIYCEFPIQNHIVNNLQSRVENVKK